VQERNLASWFSRHCCCRSFWRWVLSQPFDQPTPDRFRRRKINKNGNDRCDHLPDPPGKAKGIDKKCPPSGGSSSGVAKGDFNGDGFADLAVGVPGEETPAGVPGSGAVNVIYGSATGLTATDPTVPAPQFWSQNSPGVPGTSREGDGFGSALAAGDFNDDGFSDLAIGVPNKDLTISGFFGPTTYTNAGGVVVIYGSSHGLATTTEVPAAHFFDFGEGGRSDKLQNFSHLGSSLAWGDFSGDGIGDLAIGSQAPLLKKCSYPLGQQSCQSDNFFIAWSRQHLKLRIIPIVVGINAVYGKRVNMQVEPQSGVEALDERHRATLRIPHGAEFAGAFDESCKDGLGEDGKDIGHETRIVGQAVP